MKFYLLITITLLNLSSYALHAKLCLCTYPNSKSQFGKSYKGEVGAYKAGCVLWLLQKKCSANMIKNVNTSLLSLMQRRVDRGKSLVDITIGYVGHWKSSTETLRYLDTIVKPVVDRYGISVELDNTGCNSLDETSKVQAHLMGYDLPATTYIHVRGNQTTSIGLWDKIAVNLRSANLYAVADTRNHSAFYPYCNQFENKRCSKHQESDEGHCQSSVGLKKLSCQNMNKKNRSFRWTLKD